MRVIVTGSSRGIGRSLTAEFARRGHGVIATARGVAVLAWIRESGLQVAERQELDVTDDSAVGRVAKAVGPGDVPINAAGAPLASCPAERHPIDDLREQFEVHVVGMVRMVQAFVPAMRIRGSGMVVSIGSVAGRVARPLHGAADCSQFTLEGIGEALHHESGHFGVKVLLVEPGMTTDQPGKVKYGLADHAPEYAGLFRVSVASERGLTTSFPIQDPDQVATAVTDAVESGNPPLPLPLGGDAHMIMALRAQKDDVGFETRMREILHMTWRPTYPYIPRLRERAAACDSM